MSARRVFLSLSPVARMISSCLAVFVPVFFTGVIFATAFRKSRQPDIDFGCNFAGIVVGGLSVAIASYLLSLASGVRRTP